MAVARREDEGADKGGLISFTPLAPTPGLEIIDHIEGRRCQMITPNLVEAEAISTETFYMPVDHGIRITTSQIELPHTMPVYVRNSWGIMVNELSNGDRVEFPEDRYSIELCAPIKLYVNVDSQLAIEVDTESVVLEFPDNTVTSIGARSHHEHPAATITVTDDPRGLMEAVSYFGSALKTLTCERSYPTLRGHPPTVERGDELHIPNILEQPDSGVTIELPPDYRHIFVTSSLAYYSGANVVPGDRPRIVTNSGFSYPLWDEKLEVEDVVERVLKQIFFLDCVTRTEGYYQVNLHERDQIEPDLDLNFAELYDASLAEQIEAYLDVPFSVIESEIPKWKLTAHVVPEIDNFEYLPFLVQDLSILRTAKGEDITPAEINSVAIENFMRGEVLLRSSSATRGGADGVSTNDILSRSFVQPEVTESLEQTWVGPGVPVGASKAMITAYKNQLDQEITDGDIEITVVCNDIAMEAEGDVVNRVYGSRNELTFEVNAYQMLTKEELRDVLRQDIDFLHYIGHIDDQGFECIDGMLDVSLVDHVGVDSFFLNACTSYEQGKALIGTGSVGGVVTLNDVVNSGAEEVGKTLAKLLNQGFPIRAALSIAKTQSFMGNQYIVLGDGNADITQPVSGTALMLNVKSNQDDFTLEIETFPTSDRNIGSMFVPYLESNTDNQYHLCSGPIGPFEVSAAELTEYIQLENFPVFSEGNLFWSHENSADEISGEYPL